MADVEELLRSLVGQRIAGGCDDCDAYQELHQLVPGCYVVGIFHDDWCPELQLRERRSDATPS